MQNKSFIAFIAGAIAGGLAVWFLQSDEGKEMLEKMKSGIGKLLENETTDNESEHESG